MRPICSPVELLGSPCHGFSSRGVHNTKIHISSHRQPRQGQLHVRNIHTTLGHSLPRATASAKLTIIKFNRYADRRWAHFVDQAALIAGAPSHDPAADDGPHKFEIALDALLVALRQEDPVKLYFCLLDLTQGARLEDPAFCEIVQRIPATTFSEILRTFDPFNISKHVDSAPDITISFGAALHTPLGDLINKWGVKILYVRIFNRLRLIQQARRASFDINSQQTPLLNDYIVLIRCAGAISDIKAAKNVYYELDSDGLFKWKHPGIFTEFIKARYLTEALYANNDLARFRLRPLSLHRSGTFVPEPLINRLKHLQANMTNLGMHRFGQNANEPYFAEHLIRILRRRKPLHMLQVWAARHYSMRFGDEALICAFLKANGRNGRILDNNTLLKGCWGIKIIRHTTEEGPELVITGGIDLPPDSCLCPTAALLDAIVHGYGSMGEITLALKLVQFISQRYAMPVPDAVWSDLLSYTRIMLTKPAVTEWNITGFLTKIAKTENMIDIWQICTNEPYNFNPGLKDYYNLVASTMGTNGPTAMTLQAIQRIRPLYDKAMEQLQDAWVELVAITRQGMPNHAAYRRYRVLQSRKHQIWYRFHYLVIQILKHANPAHIDDDLPVRWIPKLLLELTPFLPRKIKYRIATGVVEFEPDEPRLRLTRHASQAMLQPDLKNMDLFGLQEEENKDMDEVDENGPIIPDQPLMLREEEENNEVEEDEEDSVVSGWHITDYRPPDNAISSEKKTTVNQEKDLSPSMEKEEADDDYLVDQESDMYKPACDRVLQQDQYPGDTADDIDERDEDHRTRQNSKPLQQWFTPTQLIVRPAHMYRPRYNGPHNEVTLTSLRYDGKEFTGYHDDPIMKHWAAHRVLNTTVCTVGVPVNLDENASTKELADQLRLIRT